MLSAMTACCGSVLHPDAPAPTSAAARPAAGGEAAPPADRRNKGGWTMEQHRDGVQDCGGNGFIQYTLGVRVGDRQVDNKKIAVADGAIGRAWKVFDSPALLTEACEKIPSRQAAEILGFGKKPTGTKARERQRHVASGSLLRWRTPFKQSVCFTRTARRGAVRQCRRQQPDPPWHY